jgi:hypothetical protein
MLVASTVTENRAVGGPAGTGGTAGEGIGGGVYVTAGANAFKDEATIIAGNSASTSDDDVFGDLFEL